MANSWVKTTVLASLALLAGGALGAQQKQDSNPFALAVGVGLVEPTDEVETYVMAALRIGVGGGFKSGSREAGGMRGYLEPEVGYWKRSDDRLDGGDLLVGVNLIGAVPFGQVDSFFGVGAGAHFIDRQLLLNDPTASGSDTKLGVNAQFGIDLYLTDNLSAFGASRFDLVQDSDDQVQSKVYLGLRARF
jgi:hypothetical protein